MTAARVAKISSSLTTALRAAETKPEDVALKALAKRYAAMIDTDPLLLIKVGPLLLAALVELGMTPRARAAVVGGKGGGPGVGRKRSPVDELRDRRTARKNGTAAVDAAP